MANSYPLLPSTASAPIKVTVPNLTANGNILTATTSVDIAQTLEFLQTTASITGTLLNPTITTNYYEISAVNNGTADFTLASTGDSFVLPANKVPQKIAWSGTATSVWKLVSPALVISEYVEVSVGQISTNLVAGTDHIKFDTVNRQIGTSITPDVSTGYTSTLNVNSLGRILLQPNRTYELEGDVGDVSAGANSNYITYDWHNADTGAIIQTGTGGSNIIGANLSNINQGRTEAKATITPTVPTRVELRIRQLSGVNGYGGQFANNRSRAKISVVSAGVGLSGIAGAVQGQIIQADQTTDYGNWILLDGRLKSALTTAQQAVATALGYGVNIPDMRGRLPIGANATYPYQTTGGSNTIAQNNLPNVALSISGSTSGNAVWTYNGTTGNARISNGGFTFDGSSVGSLAVGGSTSSMNGNVTQQPYTPPYRASNYFVWLGPSASTVTTSQPLTLTTTGSGASTFNIGTGALNIPIPNSIIITENNSIAGQSLGSAAWQNVTGSNIVVPTTGQYKVEYSLSWSNPSSNVLSTRVVNSAVTYQPRSATNSFGLQNTNVQSFIANYTAGETLNLQWVHTTGSSTLINNTAGTANAGGETYIRLIKIN
jgi:hypothetical protein